MSSSGAVLKKQSCENCKKKVVSMGGGVQAQKISDCVGVAVE